MKVRDASPSLVLCAGEASQSFSIAGCVNTGLVRDTPVCFPVFVVSWTRCAAREHLRTIKLEARTQFFDELEKTKNKPEEETDECTCF